MRDVSDGRNLIKQMIYCQLRSPTKIRLITNTRCGCNAYGDSSVGTVSTIHGRNPNVIRARTVARGCCLSRSIKADVTEGRGLFAPDITAPVIPG